MSVRPSTMFVCGINDAKRDDPRYKEPSFSVFESLIPYNPKVFLEQRKIFFDQVFVLGNPCTNLSTTPVVGYIIDKAEENFSRGLALALKWGTDDQVIVIGHDPIPGEWTLEHYRNSDGKEIVNRIVKENRWMDNYTPWYVDLYLRRALHILHAAGWVGVTRDMLKFMIVIMWS